MYTVFRRIQSGESLPIATLEDFEQAVRLVQALDSHWPGGYSIRDSQGHEVHEQLTAVGLLSPQRRK